MTILQNTFFLYLIIIFFIWDCKNIKSFLSQSLFSFFSFFLFLENVHAGSIVVYLIFSSSFLSFILLGILRFKKSKISSIICFSISYLIFCNILSGDYPYFGLFNDLIRVTLGQTEEECLFYNYLIYAPFVVLNIMLKICIGFFGIVFNKNDFFKFLLSIELFLLLLNANFLLFCFSFPPFLSGLCVYFMVIVAVAKAFVSSLILILYFRSISDK